MLVGLSEVLNMFYQDKIRPSNTKPYLTGENMDE
jgi:hypothetical protein